MGPPGARAPRADHPRMRGEDASAPNGNRPASGSPPHARGRRRSTASEGPAGGITPACAGKTGIGSRAISEVEDHPRMRGEDAQQRYPQRSDRGSPPHARGRLRGPTRAGRPRGITPACAGKTVSVSGSGGLVRDHPRMRGEDVGFVYQSNGGVGSPPHARGRRLDFPENPTKLFSSLPIFLSSQPSPLKRFLCRVLGVRLILWKQH